jgi:hypothetical protein
LQAAEEELPFEKRRSETDALERFAGFSVSSGFQLCEGPNDAIEIVAQYLGEQ